MKRTGEQAKRREAGTTNSLSADALYSVTLTHDLPTLDKGFGFLIRLYTALKKANAETDILDGRIPEHYYALAEKYCALTTIIKEAL